MRYGEDLTDGKYFWNFSGSDETAMSRDYIITPTGSKIYDRKVMLLKKHNFTEDKDGNQITTEIYDTKPKIVTDEVAKYILNDGPPPPILSLFNQNKPNEGLINPDLRIEQDKYGKEFFYNSNLGSAEWEERVVQQFGSVEIYNDMVKDYLEHQEQRLKYENEGWIIYYPDEKLSLSELNERAKGDGVPYIPGI